MGIDPGMSVGVACLDLNGKVVMLKSGSAKGREWIVEQAKSAGIPIIVASDKSEPGDIVKKTCSAFNALLFVPQKDIELSVKRRIAKDQNIKNPHERDAYVAAFVAYKHFLNKFRQIEHIARQKGIEDSSRLKAMVVLKHSLDEAISGKYSNRRYR